MAALSLMGIFLVDITGCQIIIAGAVDSAETAVWLSRKLTKQFNKSYERTTAAVESALASLNMGIVKKTKTEEVTQIRSKYIDGKEVWIDIRPITETSTKVEVRVGVIGDKPASAKILEKIESYL